ncbi:efflux RND transporter permease subunit [Sphingosinicella microcystinivorans]|uniref:efflux RND transporter permease subunit n=1 Tax=Sphingosinicella microcystinivorans TaxID=335406 RepID=UPI0022F3AAB2|nr:efflux RND transporter permease subunit [Sphingosinicella microcystinivorans]WBX83044.1 efflux RND transporter permease subunit [Sphingosinicella microcystinivorans]
MNLAAFAVGRWQLTLVLFTLLAALGINAFLAIPRAVDPHLPIPVVLVVAAQPGADAQDMEETVAKPIEEIIQGLDGIVDVESTSKDGSVVISAEFEWGGDPEQHFDEVVRDISAIRDRLPAGLTSLEYLKVRTSDAAVVQLALVSETASWRRMEKYATDLAERLSRIDGVRSTDIYGLPAPEVRIAIDSGRLAQLHIPPSALIDALQRGGVDLPAGTVHSGEQRLNLDAGGAYRDLAEIRAIPIRAENGTLVRVGDVAAVDWATEEHTHITRFNGKRAVFVTAMQKENGNVLALRKLIETSLAEARSQLPPDVTLELGFDQSRDIRNRLDTLARDFAIALGLVLITLLPLGPRASMIVMISIPLSLATGVLLLYVFDFSLNQLSVSGFILALGLIVDDSIVVTENISRHLRMGADRAAAALSGTKEIAAAVFGSTGVLLFAFLPLVFLPGGAGEFTRSLPLAVIYTVGASLVVSLTIIPFLASRVLRRDDDPEGNPILKALTRGIHRLYAPVLHYALEKPRRTLAVSMALCIGALGLIPVAGWQLFPASDAPYFMVEVEAPEGTSVAATDRIIRRVAAEVAKEGSVTAYMENSGAGNPQVYYNVRSLTEESRKGAIFVVLGEWIAGESDAMLDRLRAKFTGDPDARITVRKFENGPPIDAPIAIRISGPDNTKLRDIAREVAAVIRATPGTRDIDNPLAVDRVDLDLGLDADKAALLGVAPGEPRRALRLAIAGERAANFRDDEGDTYPVVVRLPMADRQPVSALQSVYVASSGGGAIPIAEIAEPRLKSVPPRIDRFQLERTATVTAWTQAGYLTSRVNTDVVARLQKLQLPAGYKLGVGGEAEASAQSFDGIGSILLLALFSIMAVLVAEFGRFREVAVVAGVIPLGMFGGIIALLLTGYPMSYMGIIGFVALIGIEIKNSILLVDFTTQLRERGLGLREAIEQAGEIRFLPVLLTSVTAIGGLMPLALGGSALYSPLAWVIIGGLISSTLLSRIVTPVMYLLIVRKREDEDAPAVSSSAGIPS